MKNTLSDLNNYLFEQIERLQDDNLTESQLDLEIKRAEAVRKTADTIIQNASLAYRHTPQPENTTAMQTQSR